MDIVMPQLGETVTEGTVTVWHKKVGDAVKADEILFEVSTDKVETEVPAPADGVLAEISVEEGATVDVGTTLAILAEAGGHVAAAPAASPAPKAEASAARAPAATDRAFARHAGGRCVSFRWLRGRSLAILQDQ